MYKIAKDIASPSSQGSPNHFPGVLKMSSELLPRSEILRKLPISTSILPRRPVVDAFSLRVAPRKLVDAAPRRVVAHLAKLAKLTNLARLSETCELSEGSLTTKCGCVFETFHL